MESIKSNGVTEESVMLLKQFKNGDPKSFDTIYLQWFLPVFNLLKRLTGSEHDAEDIAQDVFAALWNNRETIDPSKDIKSYIFSSARYTATDLLRKKQAAHKYLSSSLIVDKSETTSHDIVVAKELELLTEYAISRMPEQRRQVYVLSYKDGLSPAQIAERLGISTHSVSDHLYHAKKYLERILPILMVLLGFK